MDYYTVVILIPVGGHRIILDGVQAEVEIKHDFMQPIKYANVSANKPNSTYLDILLTISNTNTKQFEEIKKKLIGNRLFLHFKDIHPALIKGSVKSITIDHLKTEIRFIGNTTDKTYQDYVTEITTNLNAEIIYWNEPEQNTYDHLTSFPDDPINDDITKSDPGYKKKVHFNKEKEKKDKILKRKLTF